MLALPQLRCLKYDITALDTEALSAIANERHVCLLEQR